MQLVVVDQAGQERVSTSLGIQLSLSPHCLRSVLKSGDDLAVSGSLSEVS